MRKTEIVKAPPGFGRGRDDGKHFLITEWSAGRAEKWAVKALLAFNRGGGTFPVDIAVGQGMRGIVALGLDTFLRGHMTSEEVQPILDELLECVKMIRDPKARDKATGAPVATDLTGEDDIEETQTRFWLRSEVLRVHTGFSVGDALSRLISSIMAEEKVSPTIPTSQT